MRLAAVVAALGVVLACAGARPYPPLPEGLGEAEARASLARFARAVETARWDEAVALLSTRWRVAYTPRRLAVDFAGAGPGAREAAGRVLAALEAHASLELAPARARLPLGAGRAAVLVAERGAWRVDALE